MGVVSFARGTGGTCVLGGMVSVTRVCVGVSVEVRLPVSLGLLQKEGTLPGVQGLEGE